MRVRGIDTPRATRTGGKGLVALLLGAGALLASAMGTLGFHGRLGTP
jgi:hypothetical protein